MLEIYFDRIKDFAKNGIRPRLDFKNEDEKTYILYELEMLIQNINKLKAQFTNRIEFIDGYSIQDVEFVENLLHSIIREMAYVDDDYMEVAKMLLSDAYKLLERIRFRRIANKFKSFDGGTPTYPRAGMMNKYVEIISRISNTLKTEGPSAFTKDEVSMSDRVYDVLIDSSWALKESIMISLEYTENEIKLAKSLIRQAYKELMIFGDANISAKKTVELTNSLDRICSNLSLIDLHWFERYGYKESY